MCACMRACLHVYVYLMRGSAPRCVSIVCTKAGNYGKGMILLPYIPDIYCVYVYMFMHVLSTRVCKYKNKHLCTIMYVYMPACIHLCIYTSVNESMYVQMCVHVCMYL